MLFQCLFFSAVVKRTLTEWKRNQFQFFYICTLFPHHRGRWNLLIRVKSRSVWYGKKYMKGRKKEMGKLEKGGRQRCWAEF